MPHGTNSKEHDAVLPPDFLSTPATDLKVSRIDFNKAGLIRYRGLYAVVLDNVLTPAECRAMIQAAEATAPTKGWERAMINIGGGEQMLITESRNCGRIIWDNQDLVDRVWKRIEHVPEVAEIARLHKVPRIFGNGPMKRNEVWKFTRPNERMRFLKYVGGEYFRPHCDGSFETADRKERSYFTLHLYLNGEDGMPATTPGEAQGKTERLVGGATTFHALNMEDNLGESILPDLLRQGDILISCGCRCYTTPWAYTSVPASRPFALRRRCGARNQVYHAN